MSPPNAASANPLKVMMATPEVAPFVKIGGLADVVGALPKALGHLGHDVRVVCPLYGDVKRMGAWKALPGVLIVNLGYGSEYGRVWEATLPGVKARFYFIEHDTYFGRPEVYAGPWGDHTDNDRRFTFLSRACIDICAFLGWKPDVIHCHDWTTGLVPVMLNTTERDTYMSDVASVMTIHNLKFQGVFRHQLMHHARLPMSLFRADSLESMGYVNMLKGGLYHATKITTVSPTYSQEIQTPIGGCGLNWVLKYRAADLVGILNGIDVEEWNPETDSLIPANFARENLQGKDACKRALQEEMGLNVDPNVPIFGVVARLYDQKGLDLLASIIGGLMDNMHIQIAILGTGKGSLEHAFSSAAGRYPGKVGVYIGFSNGLAHRIIAGSDFLVMPSRFEPCGLTQMYSMRYATLPVVRKTGGLADTVTQLRESDASGTGFLFEETSGHALYHTIGWANAIYHDHQQSIARMRRAAIDQDFSWTQSAQKYADVYRWSVEARRSIVA
ncbi:MAG: glycogen synthase GlgA [Verrucomicrobiota bacterium]